MNKLIVGDNLDSVKKIDTNSIDCIITDPPYNTKNKKLTYSDTKSDNEWLSFMRERLIECHRVMKQTATMLLFIDVGMQVELQSMIYEIFGKKNFITNFVWKKKSSASAQSKFATVEHDFIIAVAKDIKKCKWNGIPQDNESDKIVEHKKIGNLITGNRKNQSYPIYIENQPHKFDDLTEKMNHKNLNYPIYIENQPHKFDDVGVEWCDEAHITAQGYPLYIENEAQRLDNVKISLTPFPGSREIWPMNAGKHGCWRCIPDTCQKLIDADMLVVKNNKIYQKQYKNFAFNKKTGKLEPCVRTNPIRTILQGDKYPTNQRSSIEIKKIFGDTVFSYAKPSELIKNLIKLISNPGDVVLDIFAGSGTTGGAALSTGRKFILCQIDENNIHELTIKRLNVEVGKDNYEIIGMIK